MDILSGWLSLQKNMVRIFLIGYMGAGKTTLGKAFAKRMGVTFIDLDWYIEERFHTTINMLFASRGESGFRQLERDMLREVAEFEDVVIATGGGTPCFFDNIDYMNTKGCTVYLDTSPSVLYNRLIQSRKQRPILKDKQPHELEDFIAQALESRLPFYKKAGYVLDTDKLESKSQITSAVESLRLLLGL